MKGKIGNLMLYINNFIVSKIPSYTIRNLYYRNIMKFKIDENAAIHLNVKFLCRRNFQIGKNSVINQGALIDNRGGIKIGSNVTLGHDVKLITADHNLQSPFFEGRHRSINIDDYVFIGVNACVIGGVILEKGAVLGAGSILTKSISPFKIFAGVPAKEIAIRNPNLKYQQDYKRLFF
jgi:acetyltransferase-like isoleucine patch superfamily enzyme